jgi:hypothetical protein
MLKEKTIIATKEARGILQKNERKLYRLNSRKYSELCFAIHGELEEFLHSVIRFWIERESCVMKNGKLVYFLGTRKATYEVRKKTTMDVTNRWLNYLCAIGLLKKTRQSVKYTERKKRIARKRYGKKGKIPVTVLEKIKPLNTFEVIEYTPELFKSYNERARLLREKNITAGNMSYNMLALNGLVDIAEEVYLERRKLAEQKKLREAKILVRYMDSFIEQKGYTTKQEILFSMKREQEISQTEVKRLFTIFQNEIWQTRTYKAPTKKDREEYGLNGYGWIIKKR